MAKLLTRMVLPQIQVSLHTAFPCAPPHVVCCPGDTDNRVCFVVVQFHNIGDHDRSHEDWLQSRVPRVMHRVLGETLIFVHIWASATSGLFGPAMLSLRHAFKGSAVLWPLAMSSDVAWDHSAVAALRQFLLGMDSSIGTWFADAFVRVRGSMAVRGGCQEGCACWF